MRPIRVVYRRVFMRPMMSALSVCALLGGTYAAPARAVTQIKGYAYPPGDACQLSIPTTDTKVRPRANGYRNEGTTSQFVICSMGGYEAGTVLSMLLNYTSTDGAIHSMTCTGVTGMTGWSPVHFSSKTVSVPSSGLGFQEWRAEDFGGPADTPIADGGLNLSVTCILPPGVALQGFDSTNLIDVGQ
jgi:hypothetical protein